MTHYSNKPLILCKMHIRYGSVKGQTCFEHLTSVKRMWVLTHLSTRGPLNFCVYTCLIKNVKELSFNAKSYPIKKVTPIFIFKEMSQGNLWYMRIFLVDFIPSAANEQSFYWRLIVESANDLHFEVSTYIHSYFVLTIFFPLLSALGKDVFLHTPMAYVCFTYLCRTTAWCWL